MNFIVDYNRPQGAFSQNLDHRFEQYSLHFLKLFFFFSFKLFQPYHAILTIVLFLNLNLSPLVWFGSTFMFLYLIIAVITCKWTQTTLVPNISFLECLLASLTSLLTGRVRISYTQSPSPPAPSTKRIGLSISSTFVMIFFLKKL